MAERPARGFGAARLGLAPAIRADADRLVARGGEALLVLGLGLGRARAQILSLGEGPADLRRAPLLDLEPGLEQQEVQDHEQPEEQDALQEDGVVDVDDRQRLGGDEERGGGHDESCPARMAKEKIGGQRGRKAASR